jgi:hypothetical protein
MRARVRSLLLGVIVVLYVISIPWYRADDQPLRVVAGLPDWVAVALGSYVAVAILNALAWGLTDLPEESSEGDARSGADEQ